MPTIPEVDTKIDTDLPTNSVGQITASRLRGVLHYISSALGGATVTSGAVPEATRTVMQTLSFASPPDSIRTNGFNEVGVGAAFYVKAPGNTIPAHWPTSGVLTTGDGTNYLIKPQNGELWVEQFGAKGRDATDTTTDQWQAFEDAKYVIMLQGNLGFPSELSAGIKIRVGQGGFYLSKPFSLDIPLVVEGCGPTSNGGTTLRHPALSECFIFQHKFGGDLTFGREGSPLNAFPRLLGGLCYVSGQTHIYKATNTGSANMSSPPTGTGTGITSGTATFDYVRERTWAEINGTGSAFSIIRGFSIWGMWQGASDPNGYDEDLTQVDGAFHSGIIMRSKATVEDCYVLSNPGHGIAVAADGDPEVRSGGNANGFIIRRCRLYYNGHAGLRIGLSDSNAGSYYDIDTGYNHRGGVEEYSFLGNRGFNVQDQFSGDPGNTGGKFVGGVVSGGYFYLARAPEFGADTADYTHTPGTDAASWIRTDGDGTAVAGGSYHAWSNPAPTGTTYAPCGGYLTNNTNSANQLVGLYIEGGGYPSQPGRQDAIWGGALGNGVDATRGAVILNQGVWQNGLRAQATFAFDTGKKTLSFTWGAQSINATTSNAPDNTIWGYGDWESRQYKFLLKGATSRSSTGMDVFLEDLTSGTDIFGWTSGTSLMTAGRSGTNYQRDMAWFPKLLLGDGNNLASSTATRTVMYTRTSLGTGSVSAAPAADGELYIYANPGTGDPWGWQVRGGLFIPLMP